MWCCCLEIWISWGVGGGTTAIQPCRSQSLIALSCSPLALPVLQIRLVLWVQIYLFMPGNPLENIMFFFFFSKKKVSVLQFVFYVSPLNENNMLALYLKSLFNGELAFCLPIALTCAFCKGHIVLSELWHPLLQNPLKFAALFSWMLCLTC